MMVDGRMKQGGGYTEAGTLLAEEEDSNTRYFLHYNRWGLHQ